MLPGDIHSLVQQLPHCQSTLRNTQCCVVSSHNHSYTTLRSQVDIVQCHSSRRSTSNIAVSDALITIIDTRTQSDSAYLEHLPLYEEAPAARLAVGGRYAGQVVVHRGIAEEIRVLGHRGVG